MLINTEETNNMDKLKIGDFVKVLNYEGLLTIGKVISHIIDKETKEIEVIVKSFEGNELFANGSEWDCLTFEKITHID